MRISQLFLFMQMLPMFFAGTVHAEIVERVVAIVNNEMISLTDQKEFQAALASSGWNDELLEAVYDKEALKDNPAKLIDAMIDDKVIDSEVKKQGLDVGSERVEQEIRSIMNRTRLTRDQLIAAIKQQGLDFAEYSDQIRKRIERQNVVQKEVSSKIKVSDEDIAAYYIANGKNKSQDIFEYTIAHILFDKKKGGYVEAKVRADKVLDKLKNGLRFEDAAMQFTEDRNFSQGGLLGTFKSGEFLPELEKSVQPLDPGKYSNVVKTDLGYHIVLLIKRNLVANPKMADEHEQITRKLYQEAFEKQFKYWLEQRRKAAFIRKNV